MQVLVYLTFDLSAELQSCSDLLGKDLHAKIAVFGFQTILRTLQLKVVRFRHSSLERPLIHKDCGLRASPVDYIWICRTTIQEQSRQDPRLGPSHLDTSSQ